LDTGNNVTIVKKIAHYFAQKNFCRTAIQQRADLSFFQENPTLPMIIGISMVVFSYVIGFPALIFMATLAVWTGKPLIGIIGGPLVYGISMLIFIIGIKTAGRKHVKALCAWMTRIVLEKILGEESKNITYLPQGAIEIGDMEN